MSTAGKVFLAIAACIAGAILFIAFTNSNGKPLTPEQFFERIQEYQEWSNEKLTDLMWYFTRLDTEQSYMAAAAVRDMIKEKSL